MADQDQQPFDIDSFIRNVAHDIWNRKMVGAAYHHYLHNVQVRDVSKRSLYGREQVMTETINWLAAFPDTRLRIDDVIWAGNEREGYLTSMRYTITGHNTGPTNYGPPTGTKVITTGIVNALVKEARIIKQWVASDELGLIVLVSRVGQHERSLSAIATKVKNIDARCLHLGDQRRVVNSPRDIRFVHGLLDSPLVQLLSGLVRKPFPVDRVVVQYCDVSIAPLIGKVVAGNDALLVIAAANPEYVGAAVVSQLGIGRARGDHQDSGLFIDLRGGDRGVRAVVAGNEHDAVVDQLVCDGDG